MNDIFARPRLPFLLAVLASLLAGCAGVPTSGPSANEIEKTQAGRGTPSVQVVDVDADVARRLGGQNRQRLFSEVLGQARPPQQNVGTGDAVEVNIWEAPPATLFGGGTLDIRSGLSTSRATVLPEQVVDAQGFITVPFIGRVAVAGRTPQTIEADIAKRLRGKANQPEVILRVLRNTSSTVTVMGEVNASLRVPLTAGGERLLDVLAAAGGVRQPISKTMVQVTRGNDYYALPLDTVIRDPQQNVPLQAGDVVTAIFQPLSFTALGATGKNEEINFEAQGISLAQALARAGGLIDVRSNAQGVFIFRFEREAALDWPRKPVATTPDGLVPVVYRVDLRDPNSFFVMQNFAISNRDVLYVANAPLAELQKFLNLIFSVTYPVLNLIQLSQ